jgi:hypothetical protein
VDLRIALKMRLFTDIRISVSKLRKCAKPPERECISGQRESCLRESVGAYLWNIEVAAIEDNLERVFFKTIKPHVRSIDNFVLLAITHSNPEL